MATKTKTKTTAKSKAKIDDMGGEALRASVGKALKAVKGKQAKPAVEVIEVIDVTDKVMGVLEQQANARKAKPRRAKAKVEAVAVVEAVATPATPDADGGWVEASEDKAADAVYAYAEKLGVDINDVVRIAKSCEEYDMLAALAGTEITDRVVWLAAQKAREFNGRVVRPHSPKTGLGSVKQPTRKADGEASIGKARVAVFGHAATAVIRALRATCGMGFAQIRNVLDAMGAESVADATIRAQMAGGGMTRGEPAPLTAAQVEQAKSASVAC